MAKAFIHIELNLRVFLGNWAWEEKHTISELSTVPVCPAGQRGPGQREKGAMENLKFDSTHRSVLDPQQSPPFLLDKSESEIQLPNSLPPARSTSWFQKTWPSFSCKAGPVAHTYNPSTKISGFPRQRPGRAT